MGSGACPEEGTGLGKGLELGGAQPGEEGAQGVLIPFCHSLTRGGSQVRVTGPGDSQGRFGVHFRKNFFPERVTGPGNGVAGAAPSLGVFEQSLDLALGDKGDGVVPGHGLDSIPKDFSHS